MTDYTKKQRNKNYNLQKSTSKIMDDLLSALTTATSNAYEFIKNKYNDLPSNKTNDTLTKNVYAEDKAPAQNTPGNSLTSSNVNNTALTNPNPVTADAVNNAPKFKPLSYGTIDKNTITPKTENEVTSTTASAIRERVKSALNSATDIKTTSFFNTFDDIDDETIKRNAPVAEETVKNNISLGILPENANEKYPYLLDGLTLFYAASEKGKNKEAKQARNVAYTEEDSKTNNTKNNKVKSISVEPQKTNVTYLNNPGKNNGSIFFDNTKIISPKYQRVYHGDVWLGEPQLDLNCDMLSQNELRKMKWISWMDFVSSEKDHITNWRILANSTSTGDMQDVVNDMITHFLDGTGTDYSNKTLTKIVSEHKITKSYMHDFTNVFKEFLEKNNGKIEEFANSKDFKEALKNNGVLLSKYAYKGIDTITGLRMAIHGWTESDVDVDSLKVLPNGTYFGTLKFTFVDNFGLDADDINEYGQYAGFRSWYILQHYDKYKRKYKPFRTIVTIDYPFSGKLQIR